MFNFFKKPAFGLDISDFSIEALELERKFGKVYLGAYGRVELGRGIVENGKILAKEKLKEKIGELLTNTIPKRLKTNQVILSLPESKTFFHIFRLPADLWGKELVKALETEASKTIPLDPGSYYSDFRIVSRTGDIQEILYAGALKEIVDEYLEVLMSAGLKLLVLDMESASLARAFEAQIFFKDGSFVPVLIADIGARTTNLTIVEKDLIRLSATVPIAGNHFTQAISEKLNISFDKAEKLKIDCWLDPEKSNGKVMFILQDVLRGILDEIKKLIIFYEKKSGREIKKILLCGGSSLLPQLDSYIGYNFDIETRVPDPWEGINVDILFGDKEFRKVIETKLHPIFFANVIGLARRGLEKNPETAGINLIPKEK